MELQQRLVILGPLGFDLGGVPSLYLGFLVALWLVALNGNPKDGSSCRCSHRIG